MRRRLRFLHKARELAYRDLGGLVFNLHRFGQRNDVLVLAKLSALSDVDSELRRLETALKEHRPVTVLHEAGVTACPRCAAIHSGEDRFCPGCGLPMSRHVDLPVAGAAASPAGAAPAAGVAPAAPGGPAASVAASGASASPASAGSGASAASAPAGIGADPAKGGQAGPSKPGSGGAPTAPAPPTPAPTGPPRSTPVKVPPGGTTPSTAAPRPADEPFSHPSLEPPPAPQPAPAAPAEDQPTKVIRPPAKRP
jgi:hypothetical protein